MLVLTIFRNIFKASPISEHTQSQTVKIRKHFVWNMLHLFNGWVNVRNKEKSTVTECRDLPVWRRWQRKREVTKVFILTIFMLGLEFWKLKQWLLNICFQKDMRQGLIIFVQKVKKLSFYNNIIYKSHIHPKSATPLYWVWVCLSVDCVFVIRRWWFQPSQVIFSHQSNECGYCP